VFHRVIDRFSGVATCSKMQRAAKEGTLKREIIRVEPLATFLEKYKAPTSTVTKHGDTIYVTGAPPFDPETGEIFLGPIERQTELVLEQLKLASRPRDLLWITF
jgi:enamine deaminase RidA (YjgF/YER057c/UK114 family)